MSPQLLAVFGNEVTGKCLGIVIFLDKGNIIVVGDKAYFLTVLLMCNGDVVRLHKGTNLILAKVAQGNCSFERSF